MTTSPDDHLDDEHLGDEELSAALDGEALGDAAQAHLSGCERCRVRSAALARATAVVATAVPAPAQADRERAIAAALAAMPVTPRTSEADVVPLARSRRRRSPAWLVPAAATIALLAAVAALIPSVTGNSDDSAESVGDSLTAEGGGAGTESAEDRASGAARESDEVLDAPPPPPDLGAVDDARGLRRRLARAPALEDQRTAAAERDARCGPEVRATRPELGERRTVATLTWQGVPAVVAIYASAGGESLALVTATADCRILAEVPVRP